MGEFWGGGLHLVLFHVAGMESNVPEYHIFLKNVNVPVSLVWTLEDSHAETMLIQT